MPFKVVGMEEIAPEKIPEGAKFRVVGTEEVSPQAKKVAKSLRFFGLQPSPESIEKIRRPTGIALKELFSGFAGLPGNIQQLVERVMRVKAPVSLPTSAQLSKGFEKLAGEEFLPETPTEEFIEKAAGSLGSFLFPLGGEIQAGRSLAAALLGTSAEKIAESLGAPEGVKTAASVIGSLIPFLTRKGLPPPTQAAKIAQREALEIPAAAIAKKLPKRRLAIAKPTALVEKRKVGFEKSIERAKDRILESVTPVVKSEKEAAQISKVAGKLFEAAEKKSNLIKGPVPTSNIQEAINKSIAQLEKTPVLATEERATLNFLRKMDRGLEVKNTLPNLMSLNKSLNKEINFMIPTSGDKALLNVKDALLKDIQKVGKGNPEFFKDWKKANALYSEFKRFTKIRDKLAPVFTETGVDFKKFEKMFTDPIKRPSLVKLFGKDQYKRLKDISKLSTKGAEVFKALEKDPRIFRQLERMGNFAIMGALMGRSKGALTTVLGEKALMKLLRGYYGRIMSDPSFSKHYVNFLKSLKRGAKTGIVRMAKKVDEDIEKTKEDIKD